MKTPQEFGLIMGNNAINDAISLATDQQDLNNKMTELRFTAIAILSSLGFNWAKQEGEETFNVIYMKNFLAETNKIIKASIVGLNQAFERGELTKRDPGEKTV